LKRFAGACGTSIPSWLDDRFDGLDDNADERAKVAADVAAEQIKDLVRRGIHEFHLYTMNRSPLVSAVLERLGMQRKADARAVA
jgi:methylenetetrahydrofolate reductase (NADPH)